MDTKQIAILTIRDDIHALAIQKEFENYKDVKCSIIETDQITKNTGLCWSNLYKFPSTLPSGDRDHIKVKNIDVIWWRRIYYPQQISSSITDPAHIDLINRDCRDTLFGLSYNEFCGIWINDPVATQLAENKLIQLSIAKQVGFRVPITLVSNDPVRIRKFCSMLNNKVIIKPVRGTHKCQVLTTKLRKEHILYDDSIRLCPAIYQEYIEGTQHIRAQCFGDEVYASSTRIK